MKNEKTEKYCIDRGYVEEVGRKLVSLKKRMYSGHNINQDVFHEKEQILGDFTVNTENRVKKIVETVKEFPAGIWRKMKFPGLDDYIRIMNKVENGECFDKWSGKLKCGFYNEENDEFGYEYTTGFDDGYPTSSYIAIPSELLWITESKLESKLYKMVMSASCESIAYTNTEYLKEKAISNAIEHIIQMKNVKTTIANMFPFKVVAVDDSRCTTSSGEHVGYNIVDKNGLGVASFGLEYDLSCWFCEAVNEYAKKVLS